MRIVGSYALGPDFMANGTVMMSERTYAALLAGNADLLPAIPVEFGVVKLQPGADLGDGASRRWEPRCRRNCGY